jgi:hypothetical protein
MNLPMAQLNKKYEALLRRDTKASVDSEAQGILAAGVSENDGIYSLNLTRAERTNAKLENFPDLTGYECFINHIHLEGRDEASAFVRGINFGRALIKLLKPLSSNKNDFKVIVAIESKEASIRFHRVRMNESWLAKDLEGYREAVLVLETSDKEIS